MTREEAIAYFKQNVEIMEQPPIHLGSAVAIQEWAKRCDRLSGAYRWAISALREQDATDTDVGHKGCEYCDGSGKHFLVDDDIPFGSYNSIRLYDGKAFLDDSDGFEIRIKFCPMCGRRLEEV